MNPDLFAFTIINTSTDFSKGSLIVSGTGALINLVAILILNYLYNYIAIWLTEKEFHRTQTGFQNALTLKMYLFQTINYYAAIFYVAFFKGRFVGTPGHYNTYKNIKTYFPVLFSFSFRIDGARQEECLPGGCYIEISLQLAITFIGNQFLAALLEAIWPLISKTLNWIKMAGCDSNLSLMDLCTKTYQKIRSAQDMDLPQYMKDYQLAEWTQNDLFYEYLEMVIQVVF